MSPGWRTTSKLGYFHLLSETVGSRFHVWMRLSANVFCCHVCTPTCHALGLQRSKWRSRKSILFGAWRLKFGWISDQLLLHFYHFLSVFTSIKVNNDVDNCVGLKDSSFWTIMSLSSPVSAFIPALLSAPLSQQDLLVLSGSPFG